MARGGLCVEAVSGLSVSCLSAADSTGAEVGRPCTTATQTEH